jgi:hypothetical protein
MAGEEHEITSVDLYNDVSFPATNAMEPTKNNENKNLQLLPVASNNNSDSSRIQSWDYPRW